jgi:hypothetical protein
VSYSWKSGNETDSKTKKTRRTFQTNLKALYRQYIFPPYSNFVCTTASKSTYATLQELYFGDARPRYRTHTESLDGLLQSSQANSDSVGNIDQAGYLAVLSHLSYYLTLHYFRYWQRLKINHKPSTWPHIYRLMPSLFSFLIFVNIYLSFSQIHCSSAYYNPSNTMNKNNNELLLFSY